MSYRRLCSAACATLLLAASCRLATPPDPSAGLGPHVQVFSPVISEQIGELFVQSDGLWAFRTPDEARAKSYKPGSLVAFGDLDERQRHLFVVVETAAWGVRFQRLDIDPVQSKTSGALIPLAALDLQTGARWGFCAGDGELRTAECLSQAAPGTRWWIYAVDPEGRVVVGDVRDKSATLPVELYGQITVGPLGRDLIARRAPKKWLAVPSAPGPRPTRPRIVVDPGCTNVGSPHRDALDAQWISAKVNGPKDPLQVTSEAVRLGADALVWCDGAQPRVAVPTLYRPRMDVVGRGFSLPPMLGSNVIDVPAASSATADIIARLGAALATGDFATADYLAEAAAREFGAQRPMDRVLVDSMAAIAHGGRPEAAARMGGWATRLQWNSENSAAWQIGMTSVESALGNRKGAIARTAGLTDVLDRVGDESRRGWVAYFWAIEEISVRGAAQEYLKPLEPHRGLSLAGRAAVARASGKSLDGLRAEFEQAGGLDAWSALADDLAPLKCEADVCASDVYGRLWMGGAVDAESLSRAGRSELRAGFAPRPLDKDPIASVTNAVAVFPIVDESRSAALLESATAATIQWARGACGPKPGADLERKARLARLRAVGEDARLRTDEPGPADLTIAWLAAGGVEAACAKTSELARLATELAEDVGVSTVPTQLLALQVEQAAPDTMLTTLRAAARFAATYERGDRCAVWTVALAGAYADANDFDNAQEWIGQATRCDVSQRQSVDLVSAYLNFQRTSTASADFDDATRAKLRHVTHLDVPKNACVGTLSLDYTILPALPADVQTLAARLRIPSVESGDDLSLVTANDRLTSARDHLKDVATGIDARSFKEAATSLRHAAQAFETVGHEVGIARVRWLDRLLFGGQAAAMADEKVTFAAVGFAALRKKGTLSEQAAAGGADANLARLLMLDDPAAAKLGSAASSADRAVLCELGPRHMRGVAIDSVDGRLETLRKDDEGPEIELVEP